MSNIDKNSQDFARLVELQQKHSETTLALEAVETKMSRASLAAANLSATDYVVLQESLAGLDEQIKALFTRHPEWREGDKKSIKTPFGEVSQRTAKELEVPNEAATVVLIEARQKQDATFDSAAFLHVTKKPNLEALEAWSDDELALVGITRKETEKVTVKPAKVKAAAVAKAAKNQGVPA